MKKYIFLTFIIGLSTLVSCNCFKPCHSRVKKKSTKKEISKKKRGDKVVKQDSTHKKKVIKLDSMNQIIVGINDTFEIELKANFSSGRTWVIQDTIPELKLLIDSTKTNKTMSELQKWIFVPQKKGNYFLLYEQKRPWETTASNNKKTLFNVIVK